MLPSRPFRARTETIPLPDRRARSRIDFSYALENDPPEVNPVDLCPVALERARLERDRRRARDARRRRDERSEPIVDEPAQPRIDALQKMPEGEGIIRTRNG